MARSDGTTSGAPGKAAAAQPKAASNTAAVPGPAVLAGRLVYEETMSRVDLDEPTRAVIAKQLAGLLPGQTVPVGRTTSERTIGADGLQPLLVSAAVSAAGLDPAKTTFPPLPVLWVDGASRLLVELAEITAELGDGYIEMSVPVTCDQTGTTAVTITFLTGTPDRPTGGVAATEDHPRGPAIIVDIWHEALIAFAWNTLLIATSSLAGVGAADPSGRPLITNALSISKGTISVLPQARHTFFTGGPQS
jgi:hypothetical protein